MLDLFDGFDRATIDAITSAHAKARQSAAASAALRVRTRHEARRANAEQVLADLLPAQIAPGDSWHVISRGDIDSLSFLRHALAGVAYFQHVALCTWCIARPDMEELRAWLDAGKIEELDFYVGEIFPSQYGDEFELARKLSDDYGGRLVVARNHAKLTLAACPGVALVMESSANVNTNPRIEQTCITHDAGLYAFYREFLDGLHSIDRRQRP